LIEMLEIEVGLNGVSFGECAGIASFTLPYTKIDLEMAFATLADKIKKAQTSKKTSDLLECGFFAKKFLFALEKYEHVLALATAYSNEQNQTVNRQDKK